MKTIPLPISIAAMRHYSRTRDRAECRRIKIGAIKKLKRNNKHLYTFYRFYVDFMLTGKELNFFFIISDNKSSR